MYLNYLKMYYSFPYGHIDTWSRLVCRRRDDQNKECTLTERKKILDMVFNYEVQFRSCILQPNRYTWEKEGVLKKNGQQFTFSPLCSALTNVCVLEWCQCRGLNFLCRNWSCSSLYHVDLTQKRKTLQSSLLFHISGITIVVKQLR